MRNIFLYIAGVIVFIIVVGLITKGKINLVTSPKGGSPVPLLSQNLKNIKVGSTQIKVAVVKTEDEKRKGLSGISVMPQDEGMIFDYNGQNVRPAFWMKDMQFPLDFIWIKNGEVIEVDPAAPSPTPGASDSDLKLYLPKETVDYVLEVNSGFASKNNITVGTKVDLSRL